MIKKTKVDKYMVVTKDGIIIMFFRTKNAAKEWIKQNNKHYDYELELEII